MHKRKHRKHVRSDDNWEQSVHNVTQQTFSVQNPDDLVLDPCLYIQAHEADIIHGTRALSGNLLECRDTSAMLAARNDSKSGLIRWGPPERLDNTDTAGTQQSSQPSLWLDRYDVRLLLDDLPDLRSESLPARPLSPSGWSDLPSDSEDMFFFAPDELEDYRRDKRRRLIDRSQEERLRALAAINGEEDPDPWGGSDEEPDEAQRELIRRTASHIISSPNSAQLEMRILANHSTDKRFAFLRGRWSRVWRTEKERAKQQQAQEAKKAHPSTAPALLGGLASYGDSDSDDEDESADEQTDAPKHVADTPYTHGNPGPGDEDVVREARRARAREWSARRRAEQSSQPEGRTLLERALDTSGLRLHLCVLLF